MNVPIHGQRIIFTKIPTASYCSTGEVYTVDRPKTGRSRSFHFTNDSGAGTFDPFWAVAQSEWKVAP